jgi:primosomal protein N'
MRWQAGIVPTVTSHWYITVIRTSYAVIHASIKALALPVVLFVTTLPWYLKSIGTKAIVDDIAKLFPDAHIMRFDTDNKSMSELNNTTMPLKAAVWIIIIGTQTLAKGLDLPKLGLVGVIIADTSLYFPDFSAQERTYQLLSQVLGRGWRGHRASRAILQTYSPDSPLLQSILTKIGQLSTTKNSKSVRHSSFHPSVISLH